MSIREHIRLAPHTAYRIGGPARYFVAAKNADDVRGALAWAADKQVPYFILGGGSNLLISDSGYTGLVIAMRNTRTHVHQSLGSDHTVFVESDAGVGLQTLVDLSLEHGLEGLEWAAGIPGHVGGAVRGNAGAFWGEIGNVIERVAALTPQGDLQIFSPDHCRFGYRTSVFKEEKGLAVVSVMMRLRRGNKEELLHKAEELREWRRAKHPLEYPNCGSVFKRIAVGDIKLGMWEKYPDMRDAIRAGQVATAYFIDKCDLKGVRMGGAEVSEKHPNFIVNRTRRAKAEHVMMLASHVRTRVHEKFGILLEEEPEFVL